MPDTIIRVENLGKKYVIPHGSAKRSDTFRDALMNGMRSVGRRLRHPLTPSADGSTREDFWALKDVSFEVKRGDVVGIIGRNGAGKSTLLKILSRITEPTTGRVTIDGRVASLLEVGTGFHPELTGRENVYLNGAILGMVRAEITKKFAEIVAFAEVEKFIDTPVKHYSSGMYMRLAFAVAAHLEPEILVVDEVLAVGDAVFQKKCLGKMGAAAKNGRTILYVSHNMASVENLCCKAVVLRTGTLHYIGSVKDGLQQYTKQLEPDQQRRLNGSNFIYKYDCNISPHSSRRAGTITAVELLDVENRPKANLQTWDCVSFRFHYALDQKLDSLYLTFRLATNLGATLTTLVTSIETHSLRIADGKWTGQVDCRIPKFPLAAGEYVIGASLGQPYHKATAHDEDLTSFTVEPVDVYATGAGPMAPYNLVAFPHKWVSCRQDRDTDVEMG